jgi:hypothetical protein
MTSTDVALAPYVTGGPLLDLPASGRLILPWSSFSEHGWAMGIARSRSEASLAPGCGRLSRSGPQTAVPA